MEILIVEDDKFCAMAIKYILEFAGYDVILAQNGNEAWQILQQESAPKLVILDWMIPGMTGIDVLHKLREKENKENKRAYVIMLTAKTSQEDIQTAREAGANDYMFKPYKHSDLLDRIKLGEQRLSQQHLQEEFMSM